MSSKPDPRGTRGVLAEIRSFVFTLVVVTFGIAFVAALFTGGIPGAEGFLTNILGWILDFIQNALNTLRNIGTSGRS